MEEEQKKEIKSCDCDTNKTENCMDNKEANAPIKEEASPDENPTDNKNLIKLGFIAKGTTCESCAEIIKRQAHKIHGVKDIDFDYATETGQVTFDKNKTDIDKILYKIEEKGYTCYLRDDNASTGKTDKIIGWAFGIIGLLAAGYFLLPLIENIQLPQISQNMGYGLLFLVGLLTGFHCVSMCGGFVVSYTVKNAQEGKKPHKAHFMYALGKTISYTIIGAAFGLLGSIVAFTPQMRGVAGVIAGIFLILYGLKMLNIVPALRNIQFHTPKFISKFVGEESQKHSSPLAIGLLNGLMIACGPLQAIYIMAAGTGSMIEGAKLLFVFALGTLPVMLSFGYLTSYISSQMTNKILKASGAIVIVLGLIMMNNGLALTGTGYDFKSLTTSSNSITGSAVQTGAGTALKDGFQEIRMDVTSKGWEPNKFVLKKGVPVRWIINGKQLNGCNNAIQVPKLNLNFKLKSGEQTIEFTPTEEGTIPFSCWMGMIQGTFIVKSDIDLNNKEAVQKEANSVPTPKQGSCGGSGGCGCGGR